VSITKPAFGVEALGADFLPRSVASMEDTTMIRVTSKSGKYIALIPESLQGGFAVVVTSWGVDNFRSGWPCSRLPDSPVRFEFGSNGDLVGLWPDNIDGEDVLALSQDAQRFWGDVYLKEEVSFMKLVN
jgi:hypothetical protein